MILRSSKYINDFGLSEVEELAKTALSIEESDRIEFIGLFQKAMLLEVQ